MKFYEQRIPLHNAIAQLRDKIAETVAILRQMEEDAASLLGYQTRASVQEGLKKLADGSLREEINQNKMLIKNLLGADAETPKNNVEEFLTQGEEIGEQYINLLNFQQRLINELAYFEAIHERENGKENNRPTTRFA